MNYQQVLALIQQFIVANGNNEITANVLRPILEAILAQPNELIGDLGDLQTNDQTDLVSAINEVLGVIYPPIGSVNTKIHPLSLFGIDPDLPELTKIAEAVKLQGPFTCNAGQQMVFRTTSTVGTQENGSIVTRYYRLLRNLTTIGGGGIGQEILPSWFMPDGVSEYANPEEDGTIIELGDIGTSEVWDVFNLGNNGDAWDMNEYRFVRATQNGDIQLWAFVGQERYYGGPDMGVEPDIFEAFESDFFLITDQPEEPDPFNPSDYDLEDFNNDSADPFVRESEVPAPTDLSTGLEAIDEGKGIGWRLKGKNPDNYGSIGKGAIDLGDSESASTTVGATGDGSTVGGGYQNEASGTESTVGGGFRNKASGAQSTVGGGYQNEASGTESTVGGGYQNKASGSRSTVGGGSQNEASGSRSTVSGGIQNLAKTFGEFVGGLWATIKEGNATSWIGTDRIFGIGNGTSTSSRSDAFNVYKNGVAELPSVTNALIDGAGAKTIPTKEWVNSRNSFILVITPLGEVLETGDVEYTFTVPYNFTLSNYWISAQVAPIGSGITVRLKVNGTYIDSTGTTITTGDYDSLASLPTITTPTIVKGDRITAEITAVGSTYEGEGLTLYLES